MHYKEKLELKTQAQWGTAWCERLALPLEVMAMYGPYCYCQGPCLGPWPYYNASMSMFVAHVTTLAMQMSVVCMQVAAWGHIDDWGAPCSVPASTSHYMVVQSVTSAWECCPWWPGCMRVDGQTNSATIQDQLQNYELVYPNSYTIYNQWGHGKRPGLLN